MLGYWFMKRLLGIVVLGLLLSGNAYALTLGELRKEEAKKEMNKCVEDGRWICEQIKIDEVVNKYKKSGGGVFNCSVRDYKAPCECLGNNILEGWYCNFKMKPDPPKKVKKTRIEAADHCSNLSNRKNKEVRNEFYKSCMQDQGYR